jgi:hypothetical protein
VTSTSSARTPPLSRLSRAPWRSAWTHAAVRVLIHARVAPVRRDLVLPFPALAADRVEGEIALSAPGCELFVVQTSRGFSVLVEHEFYSVFEGDPVRGQLHTPGPHEIEIVGEIALQATVDRWALDLDQAKLIFYPRCRR